MHSSPGLEGVGDATGAMGGMEGPYTSKSKREKMDFVHLLRDSL